MLIAEALIVVAVEAGFVAGAEEMATMGVFIVVTAVLDFVAKVKEVATVEASIITAVVVSFVDGAGVVTCKGE